MDTSQYLDIFVDETKEHIQVLSDQIMVLEKEPDNSDAIAEIFRSAHSLKGMAGTMGFKRMQHLTHDMEDVFSAVREGKMKVNDSLVDTLFRGLDAIQEYLDLIQETSDEGDNDNEAIINELNQFLNGGESEPAASVPAAAAVAVAEETATQSDAGDKAKYKNIKLTEVEEHAIKKAHEEEMNVFGATVYIQESCLLKAARAFLVFKALEEIGEIIISSPSVQEIEDEKFDFDFSLILLTKESESEVRAAIENVLEIEEVIVEQIEEAQAVEEPKKAEEPKKEEAPKQVAPAAAATQAAPVAKADAKADAKAKGKGKPVVSRSVRVDIEKLDSLMNQVSELIIAKNGLVSMSTTDKRDSGDMSAFNEQIEYLGTVTTNLHETVMKVRMVPIESTVQKFPRMIRDLSKKLDKKMELYMTGEDTELDRTVVDEIGDPLMHLLRNSADHGLESNEERVRLGKPEVGSIFLDAYQEGNNVVIEVRDDGAGINVDKVKKKMVERGLVPADQIDTITDKEAIATLFSPSFSTADQVSDVSGRGVGLDVVKTNIESLGGTIECKTERGAGSSFTIRLPLTLAIVQALMVELGNEKYAIPLASIQTIEEVPMSDIKYVQSKEVISLRGTVIPLIRLDSLLDVPDRETKTDHVVIVIVRKADKLAGLVVDGLIGQQEIVIKSIGKYINTPKLISGSTILGDGEVALILDANVLL
ncbi:MAG: chemotaxis protein CheA [Catonella sp.]|uniref:chemotaxis protein CheA n=1 Tax=Catonella sp. TaxID=2382125 RepID=UPI003FA0FB29